MRRINPNLCHVMFPVARGLARSVICALSTQPGSTRKISQRWQLLHRLQKKKKKRRIIKVPIGVFIIVIDGAEFVIQTPHDRREGSTKRESERRTGVGARAPRRARYCF